MSKRVMHKSARPRKDYIDPIWCHWRKGYAWITEQDSKLLHSISSVNWANVTCKNCLRMRKGNK